MAIAELSAPRRFRLRENDLASPPPGQVQVRVAAVGICGSDLHYFAEGHTGDTPAKYPMVLGHEPAGTVLRLGAGVSGWTAGDRVALEAPIYCYHCEFCMSGRHNLCDHVRFMSSPTEPGFFRDRVNLPAENLLPLPANLDFAEASLWEPAGIILHSFRFAEPKLGETAAVFGAGPIGLTTIAALKLAGARRIWCVEPVAHRRELALRLGADEAIDPVQADPVREVLAGTGQRGVDLAIDCAGIGGSINQAIRMARSAGRVVVTAVPSEQLVAIEFHTMRRKELGFHTVRRANRTGHAALEMLSQYPQRFTPMVTHRMMLADVQRAFETLESYSDGVGKIVLLPEA
jgi:L-iditol 2-dehydrogenase